MTGRWTPISTLALTATSLACWLLMFAAGTDIWHDTGRLDVRTLGATAADVRAFAVAFYGLFVVLLAQVATSAIAVARARHAPPAA
jgi:hypothetical protein